MKICWFISKAIFTFSFAFDFERARIVVQQSVIEDHEGLVGALFGGDKLHLEHSLLVGDLCMMSVM